MKCTKTCKGCPVACGKREIPDLDIFKNLTTYPPSKGKREDLLEKIYDESEFPNYSQSTIMGAAKILIATLLAMGGNDLTIKQGGLYNKKTGKTLGDFEVIIRKIKKGRK